METPHFHKLLGSPLELVVSYAGDAGFSLLYGAGDKLVNSRITNIPIKCVWKPSPFSNNPISLENVSILCAHLGGVMFTYGFYKKFQSHSGVKFQKKAFISNSQIPHTITGISGKFSSSSWIKLLPQLSNITRMNISDFCGKSSCYFTGFPPCLRELEISEVFIRLIQFLPRSTTSLTITRSNERASDMFFDGHDCPYPKDIRNSIYYPRSLVKIKYLGLTLIGTFPFLQEAEVYDLEGEFPSLITHKSETMPENSY